MEYKRFGKDKKELEERKMWGWWYHPYLSMYLCINVLPL
jgi:hypothetical protein